MINLDELEIVKQIIGDLSGVGIWAMLGFIAYKLLKIIFTFWAAIWLVNKVVTKWFEYIKSPLNKKECEALVDKETALLKRLDASEYTLSSAKNVHTQEMEALKITMRNVRQEAQIKVDLYKHKYEVMTGEKDA